LRKMLLSFERGGELIVHLNEQAPETVQRVLEALPYENYAMHTRWCGREISFGIETKELPPKENNTGIVSKFDVTYWRDWDNGSKEAMPGAPGREAIAFYYGPEKLSYHGGSICANIIGRVDWMQEQLLEEIGLRIWQKGFEQVKAQELSP